mmetsp:Transcript_68225/g.101373  ORF Transcript_68225/g.101373 Transcript_68225/m.101373 type:complete len:129 (+) Transcript_68225:440-826(+)
MVNSSYRDGGGITFLLSVTRGDLSNLQTTCFARRHQKMTLDKKIDKASYHVIDFNMKDLDTIERNIFFPWLREKLTQYASDDEVSDAFATVLDEIEKDRELLSKLGKTVVSFTSGRRSYMCFERNHTL